MSSGYTGDRNTTVMSTLPATSKVKMLLVDVYSRESWLTWAGPGAPPIQL